MKKSDRTLRREVEWISGNKIVDKATYYQSKQAYINLDSEVRHLKRLTMTTNWSLYDDETGQLLASKFPETDEQKAIRLYSELQNYAAVARALGVHPTTARKWVNTGNKENG